MPDTSIEPAGLAPPDEGPTFGFKSRERLEDRTTRKPMSLWDRVKMLVLAAGLVDGAGRLQGLLVQWFSAIGPVPFVILLVLLVVGGVVLVRRRARSGSRPDRG